MIEKQILENQIVIMKALLIQIPSLSVTGESLHKAINETHKLLS